MRKLSIISPVYKAERIVDELVMRIVKAVEKISDEYEIILVEDGSPDNSWSKIESQCKKNSHVKGIKLSRNFGQHYAITAGLSKVSGDTIILMDCDLQDDPEQIILLVEEKIKGFDIVFTKRKKRKHGLIKSFNSWFYNSLFHLFSDKRFNVDFGSFVCFSRPVLESILKLKDNDRTYIQMLRWVGYKTSIITVEHHKRFEGKSTYNFIKLLKIGLQNWTSYSDKLLRFSIFIGISISAISFFFGIAIFIRYLFYKLQPGWPSIIVSIFFSTGLILLSIGIAGIYIGKIFNQVKERPLFIIEKELNNE